MKLIECHIGSFGSLKNVHAEFNDGLNLRLAGNGSGKSTLAAFIRVMLYGMNESKKASLKENDRRHYLPWDSSLCRGSLTVEVRGKRYRIERSFGKKQSEDSFRLFDLESGKESSDYPESFAEEIFGIDSEGFERTAFFSERSLEPSGINRSLTSRLGADDGSEGDSDIAARALEIIEEQRRFYYKRGGGGELSSLRERIRTEGKRRDESKRALEEHAEMRRKSRELERAISDIRAERQALVSEKESLSLRLRESSTEGRISTLRREYDEVRRRRDEAKEKFIQEPPTLDEVNEEYIRLREAQRKKEEGDLSADRARLSSLKEYFRGKCDNRDIERVEEAIAKNAERDRELSDLGQIFKKRVPDRSEITSLRARKGGIIAVAVLLTIAAITAIAFGVYGYTVDARAYLVSAISVGILPVLGVMAILVSKGTRRKEIERIRAFIFSVTGEDTGVSGAVEKLGEIKDALAKREAPSGGENSRIIEEFAAKFFTRGGVNATLAAKDLIEKYRLIAYLERRLSDSLTAQDAEGYEKSRDTEKTKSPLAERYPEVSGGQLKLLKDAVMEYEALKDRAARIGAEIESLTAMKMLGESEDSESRERLAEIERRIAAALEKEESLTREHALTESRSKELSELADELESRETSVGGLSERLGAYEKNLEILQLTKAHLLGAIEAINTSYLESARVALDKYLKLLSDTNTELSIDSSFRIQRTEDGVTREPDAYSRGLGDLYVFAARLALVDVLYEREEPILILDDPFTALDDSSIRKATELITLISERRQVIYLTCSESRLPKARRRV